MTLIDTHCHLDFSDFDADRDEVIARARQNGIDWIINIGSSLEGSEKSLELAARYAFIRATIGLHPHEADNFTPQHEFRLQELSKHDTVAAIGEIGLDYFKNYSSVENQKKMFTAMLKLVKDSGLPAVIHCRQAQEDMLLMLKQAMPLKAVVHCFSGDDKFLKECLNLGFYISFTCNITYKKAQGLRDLAGTVPLDRLMLETDAPFLPPEQLRGRRNEPLYVRQLAEEIARVKNCSLEEIAKVTTENAKAFFNLK